MALRRLRPGAQGRRRRAGYIAAFGTARHHATQNDDIMALPRYIITERDREAAFEHIFLGAPL